MGTIMDTPEAKPLAPAPAAIDVAIDAAGPEPDAASRNGLPLTKFEVYGQEMLDKIVKRSGNSGRVYLPPDWVGKHTKIIRVD